MKDLGSTTEDDMIATFLRAELTSPRYRPILLRMLTDDDVAEEVVKHPNTRDLYANCYRRSVLTRYRGFGLDRALFHGFPANVSWHKAELSMAELRAVRYIKYHYWESLSGGSRLVADAVQRLSRGEGDASEFRAIVDAIRRGSNPPELILVGRADWTGLVVLEGHTRLTAYLLEPSVLSATIPVLIGRSDNIESWHLY